jgi:hypothetical protein
MCWRGRKSSAVIEIACPAPSDISLSRSHDFISNIWGRMDSNRSHMHVARGGLQRGQPSMSSSDAVMNLQKPYMMLTNIKTTRVWPSHSGSERSCLSASLLAIEDSSGSSYARKAP